MHMLSLALLNHWKKAYDDRKYFMIILHVLTIPVSAIELTTDCATVPNRFWVLILLKLTLNP